MVSCYFLTQILQSIWQQEGGCFSCRNKKKTREGGERMTQINNSATDKWTQSPKVHQLRRSRNATTEGSHCEGTPNTKGLQVLGALIFRHSPLHNHLWEGEAFRQAEYGGWIKGKEFGTHWQISKVVREQVVSQRVTSDRVMCRSRRQPNNSCPLDSRRPSGWALGSMVDYGHGDRIIYPLKWGTLESKSQESVQIMLGQHAWNRLL